MSTRFPDDIVLPPHARQSEAHLRPARMAAFVPIAVALAGVAAILVGSLTVRGGATMVATSAQKTDPLTTGSVAPAPPRNIQQILEMLDN